MAGTPVPTLFFGGKDTPSFTGKASVLEVSRGFQDNGMGYAVNVITNPIAPAGSSGECIFRNLYLVTTHTMAVDLVVWPIVDFEHLDGSGSQPDESVTISLPDRVAQGRETNRFELGLSIPYPLSGTERFRNALRGAWFQAGLAATSLADGDLILEQFELDYEVVRESVVAET